MITRHAIALVAFLLVGFLIAPAARADMFVCNRATTEFSVALGYRVDAGSGPWVASGWFAVSPGQCRKVSGGDIRFKTYYIRAESPHQDWPRDAGGNAAFCTTNGKMDSLPDEPCAPPGTSRPYLQAYPGGNITWYVALNEDGSNTQWPVAPPPPPPPIVYGPINPAPGEIPPNTGAPPTLRFRLVGNTIFIDASNNSGRTYNCNVSYTYSFEGNTQGDRRIKTAVVVPPGNSTPARVSISAPDVRPTSSLDYSCY